MTRNTFTDARYLAAEQYRNAANLDTRRALHERFSTNPYGWLPWVFDHLQTLPPVSVVLELGCGPGSLWHENAARISPEWTVMLTDYSGGMVAEARLHLGGNATVFRFTQADAQALPFTDATFDAVIANHMLYHVPNRERAYAEIQRVLRPGGRLFAATNGHNALVEWLDHFTGSHRNTSDTTSGFSLDTGGAELARVFVDVQVAHYPDTLAITEAAPFVAYALSTTHIRDRFAAEGEDAVHAEIAAIVRREIAAQGTIHIPKAVGLFLASRA